ncbi:ABC transporter substrate-binding protein [Nitrospira sp. Kam-Ns4a]
MKKRRQQGILTGMPFMANLASRTFVDDLTRKIYLASPPGRVVSLAPGATEILYAIGAGSLLVGVAEACDYPPDVQTKPKVGVLPSALDAIGDLRADLVLCPKEGLGSELMSALERLKAPTFVLHARTIEHVFAQIQTIGRMVGRSGPADALAAVLRERTARIQRQTASLPRRRVLCLVKAAPPLAIGAGTLTHHLLTWAGAANVVARGGDAVPVGFDEVHQQDPEIIVLALGTHEPERPGELPPLDTWRELAAVRLGRVFRVPGELLTRPGPRLVEGLETLARLLHPDVEPASGN